MLHRHVVSSEQVDAIVDAKEFPEEMINSAPCVAIVLTQSWCVQWHLMESWLKRFEKKGIEIDLNVFEIVYDNLPSRDSFMAFKEDVLGNSLIPFTLYFKNGKKVAESNYVGRNDFLEYFDG